MDQKDFDRLAKYEVESTFVSEGQELEEQLMAWKHGYLYFRDMVFKSLTEDADFVEQMEMLTDDELGYL